LKGTSWGAKKTAYCLQMSLSIGRVIQNGGTFFLSGSLLDPLTKVQHETLRLFTGAMRSTTVCSQVPCNEMPFDTKHWPAPNTKPS